MQAVSLIQEPHAEATHDCETFGRTSRKTSGIVRASVKNISMLTRFSVNTSDCRFQRDISVVGTKDLVLTLPDLSLHALGFQLVLLR
jgi:hypothetical protein